MTLTLADKARANRRAALASLNARVAGSENVVSIFDRIVSPRRSLPEFHSIRSRAALVELAEPVLVLTDPLAA